MNVINQLDWPFCGLHDGRGDYFGVAILFHIKKVFVQLSSVLM